MKRIWTDENITKALKKMAKAKPDETTFDRSWFKIEDRLAAPKKGFWGHIVWRPWAHQVRWVAMAACLCVTLAGNYYHQVEVEKSEVASYLIHISNPIEAINRDQNVVKVSTLLSEPSSAAPDMSDEVHIDSLASDEIFL
jgi:hypothetical protein